METDDENDLYTMSPTEERLRRLLRSAAIGLAVLLVTVGVGHWFFTGWRARDLALKARANLEAANYRLAWLQAESARQLRADEPEVLRTSALLDAAFGRKECLDDWRRLEAVQKLATEDQEQRARAAIRFGDEAAFEASVAALDSAGKEDDVSRLRVARRLSRGELMRAIEEARRGVSFSDDPRLRLDLAKLLLRRYVDDLAASPRQSGPARAAFAEMTSIVNALQDDPVVGPDALAFGLTFLLPGAETQRSWADAALTRLEPGNPALFPAATVMVENKYGTPEELYARFRSVFDAAPLEHRAACAAWLARHGLCREALALITAQEAGESAQAFLARTDALGRSGNWNAVIAAADSGGNVPRSVALLTKAKAQYELRADPLSGAMTITDALKAATSEGKLPAAIQTADAFGAQSAVSDALVLLSGDTRFSVAAFPLARERFAASGDHTRLADAYARARKVAPDEISVRDYGRYLALLSEKTDADDLAAAESDAAAAPANPLIRVTAALAKLRAGKASEALGGFDEVTIFYDRLPPGAQAVVCAVIDANDQRDKAALLARSIDKSKLVPDELRLIANIR